MNLTKYLNHMISQEACTLSKLCLSNDENNCNYEPIMEIYHRLEDFILDYDQFSRTDDII